MKNKFVIFGIIVLFAILIFVKIEGIKRHDFNSENQSNSDQRVYAFPTMAVPAYLNQSADVVQTYSYLVLNNSASFDSMQKNISSVKAVIVDSLSVNKTSLVSLNPIEQKKAFDFINAQKKPAQIYALVKNYSAGQWQGEQLAAMLSSKAARAEIISETVKYLSENKLTGVSLDFEALPASAQNNLVLFVSELHQQLQQNKFLLSIHVPANEPNWQYQKLASSADEIILMDYDQHQSNTEPGPIAAAKWFETAIKEIGAMVPKEKLVVGMASYAYDWSGGIAKGLTYQSAQALALKYKAVIIFDPESQSDYFKYSTGSVQHSVWLADQNSVKAEKTIAQKYGIYSYAVYRFGSEDQNLWKLLK
ncbi:MAG: polysaccharide deacetylase [Candidatus Doudnabacteria bacterium]|nr:polysaccharide deacetylase [Candidatus Doudnabacteria bacterium]